MVLTGELAPEIGLVVGPSVRRFEAGGLGGAARGEELGSDRVGLGVLAGAGERVLGDGREVGATTKGVRRGRFPLGEGLGAEGGGEIVLVAGAGAAEKEVFLTFNIYGGRALGGAEFCLRREGYGGDVGGEGRARDGDAAEI